MKHPIVYNNAIIKPAPWFLLLCRIHFPWLSRRKWIVFPD